MPNSVKAVKKKTGMHFLKIKFKKNKQIIKKLQI